MSHLENAWQEATELAADRDAVSNRGEAIDLAAALLKLAQSAPLRSAPALATGLVSDTMLVKSRVEGLLNWNGRGRRGRLDHVCYLCVPALAVAIYVSLHYSEALLLTHQITEWFVH